MPAASLLLSARLLLVALVRGPLRLGARQIVGVFLPDRETLQADTLLMF